MEQDKLKPLQRRHVRARHGSAGKAKGEEMSPLQRTARVSLLQESVEIIDHSTERHPDHFLEPGFLSGKIGDKNRGQTELTPILGSELGFCSPGSLGDENIRGKFEPGA